MSKALIEEMKHDKASVEDKAEVKDWVKFFLPKYNNLATWEKAYIRRILDTSGE